MIHTLNLAVSRHVSLLRAQRENHAKYFENWMLDLKEDFEERTLNLKTDAAAIDAEFATAIADAMALLGEPEQQQAAE